jgi:hypothetical protein
MKKPPCEHHWLLLLLLLVLLLGLASTASSTSSTSSDRGDRGGRLLRHQRRGHHRHHRHRHHHASPPPRLEACYDPALAPHGFGRDRFPACAVLDEGRAQLYWGHDHDGSTITLGLVMRTDSQDSGEHRWYALGLSAESQGMKGMDVAMLRPAGKSESSSSSSSSNGGWVLDDRWATDYALPALDARQDKTLLSAVSLALPAEERGRVVGFTFIMPLAGCGIHDEEHGQEDAPILPGRDTFVLWAQGVVDADSGEPQYHGEHSGATRLPLGREMPSSSSSISSGSSGGGGTGGVGHAISGIVVESDKGTAAALGVAVPEDAKVLTVTLPEMEVPAEATKYFCVYVQPPRAAKYHIYSARQVGDARVAKELVHHMGLYAAGAAEVGRGRKGGREMGGWVGGWMTLCRCNLCRLMIKFCPFARRALMRTHSCPPLLARCLTAPSRPGRTTDCRS